jgi:hypothetical protein
MRQISEMRNDNEMENNEDKRQQQLPAAAAAVSAAAANDQQAAVSCHPAEVSVFVCFKFN